MKTHELSTLEMETDSLKYCQGLTSNSGLAEIIDEKTQFYVTGALVTRGLFKKHLHWWIGANDLKEVSTISMHALRNNFVPYRKENLFGDTLGKN